MHKCILAKFCKISLLSSSGCLFTALSLGKSHSLADFFRQWTLADFKIFECQDFLEIFGYGLFINYIRQG